MAEYALVHANVIIDVIVVDNDALPDGVAPFDPQAYVDDDSNIYQRAVDLSTLTPRPAIGWVFHRGAGYLPPTQLVASRESIPADGVTAATFTFTDNRLPPATQATFVVNDATHDVPLTDGVGVLAVASSTAGDVVTVTVDVDDAVPVAVASVQVDP